MEVTRSFFSFFLVRFSPVIRFCFAFVSLVNGGSLPMLMGCSDLQGPLASPIPTPSSRQPATTPRASTTLASGC